MKERSVLVLTSEKCFLDYAHPAMARRLLKEGKAVIYSKDPFAIKLNKLVEYPLRSDIMVQTTNFTEVFREERDIYVQNISGCQVVVNFDVEGRTESYSFVNTKDPVILTQYVPFLAIKNSMDFRRMLNRIPPALQLMSHEEYEAHYARSAKTLGLKSAHEAIVLAEEKRKAIHNKVPLDDAPDPIKLHDVVEDGQHFGDRKTVKSAQSFSESEEINPRVLHLCLQVHQTIPDQQKMSAQQLISEVESAGSLTLLDWEYLQSHGYYKSVKNLARKMIADLASVSEPDEDEVVPPTKKPTKSKSLAK